MEQNNPQIIYQDLKTRNINFENCLVSFIKMYTLCINFFLTGFPSFKFLINKTHKRRHSNFQNTPHKNYTIQSRTEKNQYPLFCVFCVHTILNVFFCTFTKSKKNTRNCLQIRSGILVKFARLHCIANDSDINGKIKEKMYYPVMYCTVM